MEDRRAVRGALMRGVAIELVIEDGADRAVGERADIDGVRGGGFQPVRCRTAAPAAGCRGRSGSPVRDGAGAPGSDRTAPPLPARSSAASRRMRSMVQSA